MVITPAQLHMQVELLLSAGSFASRSVGEQALKSHARSSKGNGPDQTIDNCEGARVRTGLVTRQPEWRA
jgi:hypothetical protein